MPNYSLVANSTFQPFTYQELAAPLDRQEAYHEKLVEEYDKLSAQADILEAMGNNDRDKNSSLYNQYKSYSNSLRKEADDLYRYGLNSESRRRLSELRRRYNTDIVPIQNAWNKREEEAKMQLTARMNKPSLRFTRDAAGTDLGYYVNNPGGGYGVIDLDAISSQMSAMAKNLSKMKGEGRLEKVDNFTNMLVTPYGLDPRLVNEWQNNESASPTLTAMRNQILTANGLDNPEFLNTPNGQAILQEAIGAAQRGAWDAVGEEKTQVMDNYINRLNAQAAKELNTYKEKKRIDIEEASSNMPEWGEENYTIKTKDGYVSNGIELISNLNDDKGNLKTGYFGKNNDVNPLEVYEYYQNELNKHRKGMRSPMTQSIPAGAYVSQNEKQTAEDKAREAVLKKYGKYGVSDIISKDQYNLLEAMGYSNTNASNNDFNDMGNRINNLATQYTRYSTKMAGYDLPDESIRTSILRMPESQFKSKIMWEMKDDGSLGDEIKKVSSLNLKTNSNTKGNQVNDIQYDPQHKGKILITFGDKRVVANPSVIDARLTQLIQFWEGRNADPRIITGKISEWLNTYNKQQGKTGNN